MDVTDFTQVLHPQTPIQEDDPCHGFPRGSPFMPTRPPGRPRVIMSRPPFTRSLPAAAMPCCRVARETPVWELLCPAEPFPSLLTPDLHCSDPRSWKRLPPGAETSAVAPLSCASPLMTLGNDASSSRKRTAAACGLRHPSKSALRGASVRNIPTWPIPVFLHLSGKLTEFFIMILHFSYKFIPGNSVRYFLLPL